MPVSTRDKIRRYAQTAAEAMDTAERNLAHIWELGEERSDVIQKELPFIESSLHILRELIMTFRSHL